MARKPRIREEQPLPDFDAFAGRIGHAFRNPALLRQAMTHSSAGDPRRGQLDANERLEFIGDRVLALLTAEWLSELFPNDREGALAKRLSVLVAWDTLAGIAETLELGRMLVFARGEERSGIASRQNVLADAFEALLGALYLDGGLEAARIFYRRSFAPLVEGRTEQPKASAKTRLQEWLQGRGFDLPDYRVISSKGPDHQPIFVVAVLAAGREAQGTAESKRAAEQLAAEAWLVDLPKK